MDVGAGGAYYLATAADQIVAHPTTITGGIGVILNTYNMQDAMQQFNVLATPIKSGDKIDLGSPIKAMDAAAEEAAAIDGRRIPRSLPRHRRPRPARGEYRRQIAARRPRVHGHGGAEPQADRHDRLSRRRGGKWPGKWATPVMPRSCCIIARNDRAHSPYSIDAEHAAPASARCRSACPATTARASLASSTCGNRSRRWKRFRGNETVVL